MLPILIFAGAIICLVNLLGLALFAVAHRRHATRQRELLRQTRHDFQDALNQVLDRYQELRAAVGEDPLEEEGEEEARAGTAFQTQYMAEHATEYATVATTIPAVGAFAPAAGTLTATARGAATATGAAATVAAATSAAGHSVGQSVAQGALRDPRAADFTAGAGASPSAVQGLHAGKRASALRLHQQGETAARIAAEVGLTRAEVELLVKVHAAAQRGRA